MNRIEKVNYGPLCIDEKMKLRTNLEHHCWPRLSVILFFGRASSTCMFLNSEPRFLISAFASKHSPSVSERSVPSGFWVQSFLKSEKSVLIDLTTKSTLKLIVEFSVNFPVSDCDRYIARKLSFWTYIARLHRGGILGLCFCNAVF